MVGCGSVCGSCGWNFGRRNQSLPSVRNTQPLYPQTKQLQNFLRRRRHMATSMATPALPERPAVGLTARRARLLVRAPCRRVGQREMAARCSSPGIYCTPEPSSRPHGTQQESPLTCLLAHTVLPCVPCALRFAKRRHRKRSCDFWPLQYFSEKEPFIELNW